MTSPIPTALFGQDAWKLTSPTGDSNDLDITGALESSGNGNSNSSSSISGSGPSSALFADVDEVLNNVTKNDEEKKVILQTMLVQSCSNGDLAKVQELLNSASNYIEVDQPDESGNTPLIYSVCFNHEHVVEALLRFGASTDIQDAREWTALMWAVNGNNLGIVRQLMENGADLQVKTSSGRSAMDFVSNDSPIYQYWKDNGYIDQQLDKQNDFYTQIVDPTEIEHEFNKQLEETALDLDVDMAQLSLGGLAAGSVGIGSAASRSIGYQLFNDIPNEDDGDDDSDDADEKYGLASAEEYAYGDEGFIWDRCVSHQMLVFSEKEIPKILDVAISEVKPQRSRSQKPIPANVIFLCSRYACYFDRLDLLETFLEFTVGRIKSTILDHKQDIAFLSFWISNCCLMLYYCRKDPKVNEYTKKFQTDISLVMGDLYVLITQDVEERLDRVLDASLLDHETIPGLDSIHYQKEWKIFQKKPKVMSHKDEMEQVLRPPSPTKKALPSPRNVTSILSSMLFMLDLYEVHPVITQQIVAQVVYWIGAILFNRVMMNKKYLARSRAMQIRLNISAVEDWARINNRRPKDADEFSSGRDEHVYPSTMEICRDHLKSLVQILQWLQCFTGFGDDFTNVVATLQQLTALNPLQLLHVANKYRAEVGENGLSKEYKKYLASLQEQYDKRITHKGVADAPNPMKKEGKEKDDKKDEDKKNSDQKDEVDGAKPDAADSAETIPDNVRPAIPLGLVKERSSDEFENKQQLYLDASKVLPFILPTHQEMIITWGAGLGGTHNKRARKHEPFLPSEVIQKFGEDSELDTTQDAAIEAAAARKLNPSFEGLSMPEPTVQKTWGGMEDDDYEVEDLSGGWA